MSGPVGRRCAQAVLARLRWAGARGQALSEYVVMVGILTLTVIGAMTMFQGPMARIVVRLARHIVVYLTS
jgi:hypothetical protein